MPISSYSNGRYSLRQRVGCWRKPPWQELHSVLPKPEQRTLAERSSTSASRMLPPPVESTYYSGMITGGKVIMPRSSPFVIELTGQERRERLSRSRQYTSPYRDVIRAKIVLMASQGRGNDVRREGSSQASALTSTTTLEGKRGGRPAARLLIKAAQSFFVEALPPLADDLARRVQARGGLSLLDPPASIRHRNCESVALSHRRPPRAVGGPGVRERIDSGLIFPWDWRRSLSEAHTATYCLELCLIAGQEGAALGGG